MSRPLSLLKDRASVRRDGKARTLGRMRSVVAIPLVVMVIGVACLGHQLGWGRADVTAVVANNTSEALQALTLHVETCGEKRQIVAGRLNRGETRRLRYAVCGEGGYTVEARLESGRIVRGGGGYVENGYRTSDRVSDQNVASVQAIH